MGKQRFLKLFRKARGASLQVWVNGRRIRNVDLDMLANSSDAKPGVKRSSGRIGFQQHTGEVRFRNIEIKELPPPKKLAEKRSQRFFNGEDLAGWEGLDEHWKVEEGALVGSTTGARKAHTFLCSERKYRNFELKFEVKFLVVFTQPCLAKSL